MFQKILKYFDQLSKHQRLITTL